MKHWQRGLAIVLAVAAITSLLVLFGASASATSLDRLGGVDRYATAERVAQRVKEENRAGSTVLLTTGENFPDALSAGGWPDEAVVLLTRRTSISTSTLDFIAQSWVRDVYVIGGTSVVDEAVLDRVRALGKNVVRLWGRDRYATSLAVSSAGVDDDSVTSVWVAPGASFADQLVAAAAARRSNGAFLIVPPSQALDTNIADEIRRIAATGATLHVVDSGSVLGAVSVSGLTRVAHTGDVHTNSVDTQSETSTVVVASAQSWPDALSGMRLVSSSRGLVLSQSSCAPSAVASRLQRASTAVALGGTAALTDAAARGTACGTPTTTTPSTTTPPTTSPLAGLRVESEFVGGYDRALFRHWIDADRDGCDTRREVLIEESTTPVGVGSGCSLTGGTWFSAYDGVTTIDASTFDIDHMVPLKEAWDSGAHAWSTSRREAFANDLSSAESLIAVSASSNRSKSDRDPAEWMPPRTSYHCTYVEAWIAVKKAWDLSVDQAEYRKLEQVLANC